MGVMFVAGSVRVFVLSVLERASECELLVHAARTLLTDGRAVIEEEGVEKNTSGTMVLLPIGNSSMAAGAIEFRDFPFFLVLDFVTTVVSFSIGTDSVSKLDFFFKPILFIPSLIASSLGYEVQTSDGEPDGASAIGKGATRELRGLPILFPRLRAPPLE